ncbi:hypothetical protein [Actinophytocola sp.]|uniref:hypothetical protein n=1 Tax=Actinophytocola sp. TaxID=1872138 RepID=UPI003D6B3EA5
MTTFEVFSPEGRPVPKVRAIDRQRVVSSLAEAKVAEVWDYRFRGDEVFSTLRDSLGRARPGAGFVGYDNFGDIHGPDATALVEALPGRLDATGADVAVVGVGA